MDDNHLRRMNVPQGFVGAKLVKKFEIAKRI